VVRNAKRGFGATVREVIICTGARVRDGKGHSLYQTATDLWENGAAGFLNRGGTTESLGTMRVPCCVLSKSQQSHFCIRCRISPKAVESQTVAAFSLGLRVDSVFRSSSSSGKLSALLLG
jgi:hypothetical protein